ncbi:MAG: hypothetical protein FWD53_05565, partial [Phycisphaerales bacterium]|nr:hypothetical protein [Phycisphaerales bacterium]
MTHFAARSIQKRFTRWCMRNTCVAYFVWICVIAVPVLCFGQTGVTTAPASPFNSEKVTPAHCGPDSLWFVFMRLGVNKSLTDVRASFAPTESETRRSLLELQQVAEKHSLHAYPLEMDRASIQRFGELLKACGESQIGAIVHIPITWGHFAPLTWMDKNRV